MKTKTLLLSLLAGFTLAGCICGDLTTTVFTADSYTVQLNDLGDAQTVTITSSAAWEVIFSTSWLTGLPTGEVPAGDYTLTIGALPNTGTNVRLGAITLQSVNGDQLYLNVRQAFLIPPMLAGGGSHSLALKRGGTVWAWGDNSSGQLGDGTTTNCSTPVQLPDLAGVTGIATLNNHSMALLGDGTAWAWGYNFYGQLGDGTTTNSSIPVPVNPF